MERPMKIVRADTVMNVNIMTNHSVALPPSNTALIEQKHCAMHGATPDVLSRRGQFVYAAIATVQDTCNSRRGIPKNAKQCWLWALWAEFGHPLVH